MSKFRLNVLTNSAMTVARRCEYEFFLRYVLGYRPVEDADALRFGTLIHKGLELYWLGHGIDEVIAAGISGAIDAFEAIKVEVLLRGYEARWGYQYLDEVVAVEHEFRAPLIDPYTGRVSELFQLGGKMDVLLCQAFVEHKTSSEDIGPGSFYWRRLRLNTQVSTYYAGARELGVEPERCIYDVIRKPALRPSAIPEKDADGFKIVLDAQGERVFCKNGKKSESPKPRETGDTEKGYVLQTRPETPEEYGLRLMQHVSENPDYYYQRGEVVRLEHEEAEAARDAYQRAEMIGENMERNRWPKNPDACGRFGRACDFFPVCTGETSIDNQERYVRVENVHAELNAA